MNMPPLPVPAHAAQLELLIGGKWRRGGAGEVDGIDRASEAVIARLALTSRGDLEKAVRSATEAIDALGCKGLSLDVAVRGVCRDRSTGTAEAAE